MAKKAQDTGSVGKWTDIIKVVQSPLSYLVFIGLVAQGLLVGLAALSNESQRTIIIVVMLIVIVGTVLIVAIATFHPRGSEILLGRRTDIDEFQVLQKLSANDIRVILMRGAITEAAIEEAGIDGRDPPKNRIARLVTMGLLIKEKTACRLTLKGRLLANFLERAEEAQGSKRH